MKCANLIGKKFGKLTVISQQPSKNNMRYWECTCECGSNKIKIIDSRSLTAGRSKSCGCLSQFQAINDIKKAQFSNTKVLYQHYSDGDLSFEDFKVLINKNCHYCNSTSQESTNNYQYYKHQKVDGKIKYNGLDRIDSRLQHDKNNCVSCCIICNKFKLNRSLLDFYNNINTLNVSPAFTTANKLNNVINLQRGINSDIKRKISAIRGSAKTRNIRFDLSQKEAAILITNNCNYCNALNGLNGIDRVDNTLGYTATNCVSCCKYCNSAKNNFLISDFLNWINRIKKFHNLKE